MLNSLRQVKFNCLKTTPYTLHPTSKEVSAFLSAIRARALSPDRPVLRKTAQNPDVYFQARETVNPYYAACPNIMQSYMDKFAAQTTRHYHLLDYHGAIDAERVIILMGSGCEVVHEVVSMMLWLSPQKISCKR